MAVETVEDEIPKEVQEVLAEFPYVQEALQGLPPRRARDHAIEIK